MAKLKFPGRSFLPHQEKAWAYAADRSRVALFMEMRLGKTMVAIRWVKKNVMVRNPNARILVLAGTSPLDGWVNELKAERIPAPAIHQLWLMGRMDERQRHAASGGPGWYLNNYEAALRMGIRFATLDWDAIICDESTAFRNPKAKITKLVNTAYTYIEHRAILTGLPNPESSLDYVEQMRFLLGHFLGFHNFWALRFSLFKQVRYDWVPKPGTREKIKGFVHEHAFVMTAKEAGIGNRQIFEPRYVEASPQVKVYLRQVKKDFRFEDMTTKWATTRELWLARLAGGFSPDQERPQMLSDAKIKELWNLMTGELKGQQLVIWFRFNEELFAVEKFLKTRGVDTGAIMGAVPVTARGDITKQFQRGKLRAILMQTQTGKGGMGMDLSAADTAIYFSLVYDFEVWAQSLKRIEHPTKRNRGRGLLYIPLLTRGTVDEDAYETLRDKRVEAHAFHRALWSRILNRQYGMTEEHIHSSVQRIYPGQID